MNPLTKAIIFFAIVFAASAIMSSCVSARMQRSAGCQNGYVGYGTKVHTEHGPHRKTF